MTPLDYYLWGAVKDKCYADNPKTIDALKDNIREAIVEIQLHTIDNVLKNWTVLSHYVWHVTQPKLHTMYCVLILKIALAAAGLVCSVSAY